MRSTLLSTMIVLSGGILSGNAVAADWYMCQTDLSIIPIGSPRIEKGMVYYLDHTGFETSRSLDRVFFILPSNEAPSWAYHYDGSGTLVNLELTDHQHFPALIQTSDDPDQLQFLTPFDSTPRSIDLELVHALRVGFNPPTSMDPTESDFIRLLNDDTLSGFIESIGVVKGAKPSDGIDFTEFDLYLNPEVAQELNTLTSTDGVYISIDAQDGTRPLDLNQTNLVQLANDPADPAPGSYLYLDRGIRLFVNDLIANPSGPGSATSLIFGFSRTTPPPSTPPRPQDIEFEPERFAGIDVEHRFIDIIALSALTPDSITPTGDRSWTPDPVALASAIPNSGLGDIDLNAPAQIRYTFPEPATKFACTAQLIAGPWSDCELVVSATNNNDQTTEIESVRLNTEHHSHEISVNLPAGTTGLVLSINPGINGPIQDHVVLRKPRVLIERPLPQFE